MRILQLAHYLREILANTSTTQHVCVVLWFTSSHFDVCFTVKVIPFNNLCESDNVWLTLPHSGSYISSPPHQSTVQMIHVEASLRLSFVLCDFEITIGNPLHARHRHEHMTRIWRVAVTAHINCLTADWFQSPLIGLNLHNMSFQRHSTA